MVDFQTKLRTMRLADSEDRALLGSNPSAAVGDGDIDRSNCQTAAPVPNFLPDVLVRKAINPSFVTAQLWIKLTSLTRPVCHLAISPELRKLKGESAISGTKSEIVDPRTLGPTQATRLKTIGC